jgi:hypothetical protein
MTDPAGVPSALGIEAVQWFAQRGENLTVSVTGRWRRRRPTWTGQPLLMIEVDGGRHRFPAMPEPPSLTGTAPGTWRMSFSVPRSLAPHLGARAWLQLGATLVPLPIEVERAVPPEGEAAAPADRAADPGMLAERRLRSSELAVQAARGRATEAEQAAAELTAHVEQLERELERARREPERLSALLAAADRARRSAEQRSYAERAVREELQEEFAERARERADADAALAELASVEGRVRELEAELERRSRQAAEAEQAAAAARAARERAERQLSGPAGKHGAVVGREPSRGILIASSIRAELAIAGRTPAATRSRARRPAVAPAQLLGARSERELIAARARHPQPRVSRLEHELHVYAGRCDRAYDVIEILRGEVESLREAYTGRSAGAPEQRRGVEPQLGAPGAVDPELREGGLVEPERLDAARSRLREAAAIEAGAEGAGRPESSAAGRRAWMAQVFRALTDRDAVAAGRLALGLLPAQHLVHPHPVAYDLVLEDLGCVRISVVGGEQNLGNRTRVELADSPRARGDVRFQVLGDRSSLAHLLAAGRVRRALGRGLARVKGDRRALTALTDLVRAALTVEELRAAGVRLEPSLALSVVALMVDPSWTKGERFTIAHQDPGAPAPSAYLHVRDGSAPTVTDSALRGPVSATIICPADSLLPVLGGASAADLTVRGEERPLTLVQTWCKRAQSG